VKLSQWGDLSEEQYAAERRRLEAELAGLSPTIDRAAELAEIAAYLRDIGPAWQAAEPEERNGIARALFQRVELEDERVAAVVPQPELTPFFVLDCQSSEEKRKRRDADRHVRPVPA
jgi:hypothetical protein